MAKPLDGIALLAYCRRLKFSKETQDVLINIRESPPSRTPGACRGNMPVWYPSKKMQCVIKAESHKVEFAFLLQVEHDDNVLEVWDQLRFYPLFGKASVAYPGTFSRSQANRQQGDDVLSCSIFWQRFGSV